MVQLLKSSNVTPAMVIRTVNVTETRKMRIELSIMQKPKMVVMTVMKTMLVIVARSIEMNRKEVPAFHRQSKIR